MSNQRTATVARPDGTVETVGLWAYRVTQHEAKRRFAEGFEVAVSERGHELSFPVSTMTGTHHRSSTTWAELVAQVRMWRNRYPNQRFYVVQP